MKARIDKLLGNLGYCSRREARAFLQHHTVMEDDNRLSRGDERVDYSRVTVDGSPLDPLSLTLVLHKPCGYVCSHKESGDLVYELLPEQWTYRNPVLTTIGRLDKETSGLLLITDDGQLVHRLTSPKHHVPKVYHVTLARPLKGDEAPLFASGQMLLDGEDAPLRPAILDSIDETHCRLTITEGRYHQVRRMFAATGNHVEALHRESLGFLELDTLAEGEFRVLSLDEILSITSGTSR